MLLPNPFKFYVNRKKFCYSPERYGELFFLKWFFLPTKMRHSLTKGFMEGLFNYFIIPSYLPYDSCKYLKILCIMYICYLKGGGNNCNL